MADLDQKVQEAKAQLDVHVVDIVKWHFSPETGCPFWLDWAKEAGWSPTEEIASFNDIIKTGYLLSGTPTCLLRPTEPERTSGFGREMPLHNIHDMHI